MSKKSSRVDMLIQINNSLLAIANDAENQNEDSIKKNMNILSESIIDVLALDNIFIANPNDKVN